MRGKSRRTARTWFYRALQFFRAMLARVREEEYAVVEALLTPAQASLFRRMERCDQRHCLDVFYTLRDARYQDRTLLQAALLHDVGKSSGSLAAWHRVAIVLMDRLAPGLLVSLGTGGRHWQEPFAVHRRHPQAGADRAAEAGCRSETVELIRRHHDPDPGTEQLAALQWADEQN